MIELGNEIILISFALIPFFKYKSSTFKGVKNKQKIRK